MMDSNEEIWECSSLGSKTLMSAISHETNKRASHGDVTGVYHSSSKENFFQRASRLINATKSGLVGVLYVMSKSQNSSVLLDDVLKMIDSFQLVGCTIY